jgi:hypothetical protein
MVAGQLEQLQSGDTISVPSVTGGNTIQQTNDESGSIVVGTIVYNDAADGVKKAKADASGTKSAVGLVASASIAAGASGSIQTDGVISLTTAQWDAVFGTTGGLAFGARYFLSAATAGLGTATAPSTVGQYVVEVGQALSTTELKINIHQSILL